jgi:PAS domain S-box-containing protein
MDANGRVNILLVDDQPAKLLSYEVILSDLQVNLLKASCASEALQILLKHDIAVVLVDACMPDMDGFELADMIRKHPRCDKTAIILVSAIYLSDFDRLRGYGCGAVDYVPVPIVPDLLRAKVGVFADLYRKTEQLSRLNLELERRVSERTAELEASTTDLRSSEAKFRRTFECNMIPMGVWNADGVISEANDALLRLTGYDRDDLAARRIRWARVSSADNGRAEESFWSEVAQQGVAAPHERVLIDKNGREVPVLFGGASFDAGAACGVFFAVDLTERKWAEEERTRLLESERRARAAAEAANRQKDEFLAMLSHELRTPINAVLGWVQLMGRGKLDKATTDEGLRVIERGVRTQVRLIDELLDVNRIASGIFRIHDDPVDFAAAFNAALETMVPEARDKGVNVVVQGDPCGIALRGDATKLQQVIWNLVSNAVKFTSEGGRIDVAVCRVGESVQMTVSDNGQGIKPEFLPHVFERFRQQDSSTTRRHGGLGLGLSIAKYIVEMHGGTITAESAGEGQGSRFIVSLPIAASIADAVRPIDARPVASDLTGIRVLIVDDDAATREIVSRTLTDSGATTFTAASADAAMRAFEDWHPDVVVCDIGMPVKDGYALMRELRAHPRGAQLSAIALTAYTSLDDRARALSSGYNKHLGKPVNPHQLLTAVAELAGSRREIPPQNGTVRPGSASIAPEVLAPSLVTPAARL